jgi:hypothetical protein
MRTLTLLLVILTSGCVTLATFDNGCQGNYADLCRYYVTLEARCQSAPEVPETARPLCVAQARQAYRDDVQQREQQRVRQAADAFSRGAASVPPAARPHQYPTAPDPAPARPPCDPYQYVLTDRGYTWAHVVCP